MLRILRDAIALAKQSVTLELCEHDAVGGLQQETKFTLKPQHDVNKTTLLPGSSSLQGAIHVLYRPNSPRGGPAAYAHKKHYAQAQLLNQQQSTPCLGIPREVASKLQLSLLQQTMGLLRGSPFKHKANSCIVDRDKVWSVGDSLARRACQERKYWLS